MKKNVLVILFLIAYYTSASQAVSGYLGKRFIVGYSNYFMFGPRGPGPTSGGPKDDFNPTLNNVHCLNFEYTQKQRVNICATVQYLKTGIAYDRGQEIGIFADSYIDPYSYPGRTRYKGKFGVPAQLTSLNFGLGFKLFHLGYVAPLGGYQKFEFLFMLETVKFDNKNFYVADPDNFNNPDVLVNVGPAEYKYKNVVLAYTLGKQRILFDCIVLDYGMRFGVTPAGIIPFVFSGYADVKSSMDKHFRSEVNKRIFRQQLVNLHLGIGFLAF